jgi:hypothetical protein
MTQPIVINADDPEAIDKLTPELQASLFKEMSMYYRAAAYAMRAVAQREQRRFYISVACNVVLLATIWFAL